MSITKITRDDIEEILRREFAPAFLEVVDDSAAHSGHAEALLHPKAGHYRVTMVSEKFAGESAVKRHRLVYQALADLMDSKIHALSLNLMSGQENKS